MRKGRGGLPLLPVKTDGEILIAFLNTGAIRICIKNQSAQKQGQKKGLVRVARFTCAGGYKPRMAQPARGVEVGAGGRRFAVDLLLAETTTKSFSI